MFGRIFKLFSGVVEGIINQIMQQVNVIQDAVTAPLRAMVSEVMGGIWKGNGADRFVEEMTSEVIPSLVNIAGVGTNYGGALKKAMDRMMGASKSALGKVSPLTDIFSRIF
jgi:phage-related protein